MAVHLVVNWVAVVVVDGGGVTSGDGEAQEILVAVVVFDAVYNDDCDG